MPAPQCTFSLTLHEQVYLGVEESNGEVFNVYQVNSFIPLVLQNVQMPITVTYRLPGLPYLDGTYATVSGPISVNEFHVDVVARELEVRLPSSLDVRPPLVSTTRLRFTGTIMRAGMSGHASWRAGVLEFDVAIAVDSEDAASSTVQLRCTVHRSRRVFSKLGARLSTLMVVDIVGDISGWVEGLVRVDVVDFECRSLPPSDSGARPIDTSVRRAPSPNKRTGRAAKQRSVRGVSPLKQVAYSSPAREPSPPSSPSLHQGSPAAGLIPTTPSPKRSPLGSPFLGPVSPPPRTPSPLKEVVSGPPSMYQSFIKSAFTPGTPLLDTTELLASTLAGPEPVKASGMDIELGDILDLGLPSYEAATSPERIVDQELIDTTADVKLVFPAVEEKTGAPWDGCVSGWDASVQLPSPDFSRCQPMDLESLKLIWAGTGVDPELLHQQLNGILADDFEAANSTPLPDVDPVP